MRNADAGRCIRMNNTMLTLCSVYFSTSLYCSIKSPAEPRCKMATTLKVSAAWHSSQATANSPYSISELNEV